MPKLTIKTAPKTITWKHLIVNSDTYDIVDQLSAETGVAKSTITAMMVDFAVEHLEIEKN